MYQRPINPVKLGRSLLEIISNRHTITSSLAEKGSDSSRLGSNCGGGTRYVGSLSTCMQLVG